MSTKNKKIALSLMVVLFISACGTEDEKGNNIWEVSNIIELREALESSALNGANDTIILSKGVYNIASDQLGTLNFFDEDEGTSLCLKSAEGLSYNDVVLDGNNSAQVIFYDNKKTGTLILENLSVINGKRNYSQQYPHSNGGGVYSNQNMILKGCRIDHNRAYGEGGGLFVFGTIKVSDSIISNNKSTEEQTGAGFIAYGGVTIENSKVINNTTDRAVLGNGGGFYSGATTRVVDSLISGNELNSKYGHGAGFFSKGDTEVINSIIENNILIGPKSDGAGFYTEGKSTVKGSSFYHNHAGDDAGGFYSQQETIVSNCKFINNIAEDSAGGLGTDSNLILVNSLIVNNRADAGAILHTSNTWRYNAYIINNTFIGNGGSANAKGVFINNIFAQNSSDILTLSDSKIYYNYVDYTKIDNNNQHVSTKNNIRALENDEIHMRDDNMTLTGSSPFVDAGLNPNSSAFKDLINNSNAYSKIKALLQQDYFSNPRVYNEVIDMGLMEYGNN